jgi:hypothetical protein
MPDLVSDVKVMVDDASAVFWTADHIYDTLNQVLLEVWRETEHDVTTVALGINSNNDIISLPANIYIPLYITTDTNKQALITSHAELERYSREWRGSAVGVPKWFVKWDAEHVRIYPRAQEPYDYTVTGVAYPTEITSTTTTITGLDRRLHTAIVHLAAANLCEFTMPQWSDAMRQIGMQGVREYRSRVRKYDSHNIRRIRPGNLFNRAQGGNIKVGQRLG